MARRKSIFRVFQHGAAWQWQLYAGVFVLRGGTRLIGWGPYSNPKCSMLRIGALLQHKEQINAEKMPHHKW
jgi:hypothetical protein